MNKFSYDELERMMAETRQAVPLGSRWRHYKGTEYIISDIAIVEATNEVAIIYTSAERPAVSFVRPLSVWREAVEWNDQAVSRFTEVY